MKILIALLITLVVCSANISAQPTEFTYQGKLVDGSLPANANYDFDFRLFAAATGGASIAIQTMPGVSVSNGAFTVRLDFGTSFDGEPRWLEIGVRPSGGAFFTTLNPRQSVSSSPYSIQSLNSGTAATAANSLSLAGINGSQYVITTDTRMTDARNPLANSGNYVQNTTSPQAASNFNISGDGTANIFNATTQYNIGGSRVLTASSFFGNIFAGVGAGSSISSGQGNSFFGNQAGQSNVTGGNNSFFGKSAGNSNTGGGNNSFFGEQSGFGTATGASNSFFGQFSGRNNQTGSDNAFFGYRTGQNNTASGNSFFGSGAGDSVTTGQFNAFFGRSAGAAVITGFGNSFFGDNAGLSNTGSQNSFFGRRAGAANTTGEFNSFFGYATGDSNTTALRNSHFGANAGSANTDGNNNSFFGYDAGRLTNPSSVTTGHGNSFFGAFAGNANTTGRENSFFGANTGSQNSTGEFNVFVGEGAGSTNTTGDRNTLVGWGADVGSSNLQYATAIGAGAVVTTNQTVVLGTSSDTVRVPGNAILSSGVIVTNGATITGLIRLPGLANSGDQLCITADNTVVRCFSSALPLRTENDKEEIAKQEQIDAQRKHLTEQQRLLRDIQQQIDGLKKLVCLQNATAHVCQEEK
jgi:hypothetical protein